MVLVVCRGTPQHYCGGMPMQYMLFFNWAISYKALLGKPCNYKLNGTLSHIQHFWGKPLHCWGNPRHCWGNPRHARFSIVSWAFWRTGQIAWHSLCSTLLICAGCTQSAAKLIRTLLRQLFLVICAR